jgi:hypothetical protein
MKLLIKKFNNLIKKTIFNVKNKTNNNFKISNFNKFLITFISLLFFYLFYLSIPVLYDKTWVQNHIESQLKKEFKINFSISSNISYRILPTPHFLIKDSKIFNDDNDKTSSLADIKNLKIFVSQANFFDKEKSILKYVKIDQANFTLLRKDFKFLKRINDKNFSKKKIEINKSNIFFKDNSGETITIIKISKAFLVVDDEDLLKLFNLKGTVFNMPFKFSYKKFFDYSKNEEINIDIKKLKLNIFNTSGIKKNNLNKGKNIISFLDSKIQTDYKIINDIVIFNSNYSRIKNTKVDYNGELSINPLDLNLNINLDNYEISKVLDPNFILIDLIKTELLFNNNINLMASITTVSNNKKYIFQKKIVNFNIFGGKINLNKTRLVNNKIGSVELQNSNLFFEEDKLIFNTDIMVDIVDLDELFSILQTNKRFRKKIKTILINLDYNFLTNQIKFNNIKIDNRTIDKQLFRTIEDFNDNSLNNWNRSRRLLNTLFEIYEG